MVAAATGGSTGGGNVTVCRDPKTGSEKLRLLDYYEAEILMPELKPALGNGETELDRVQFVLNRLRRLDPKRAEEYEKVAESFDFNTRWINGVTLPDINDHAYVPKETNCKIEQVAIQRLTSFPEAKKYIVRKDYWDRLSVDDRAGLILHEVIYEEALRLGHKNSMNARYLNALFSSQKLDTMDRATYQERMMAMGFDVAQSNSPPRWLVDPVFVSTKLGETVRHDLAASAQDPDGDPLEFETQDAPTWLALDANGTLTGKPSAKDVGEHTFRVQVSDGKAPVVVTVRLLVAPKAVPVGKELLAETTVGTELRESLYEHVYCPGAFSFAPLDLPKWLAFEGTGDIAGTPGLADVGDHSIRVAIRCAAKTWAKTYRVRVYEAANQPIWAKNPAYPIGVMEGTPYQFGVAYYLKDRKQATRLVFSKISGPAWAAVEANGNLRGTPSHGDIGTNTFLIRATEPGGLYSDLVVHLTVIKSEPTLAWPQATMEVGDWLEGKTVESDVLIDQVLSPDGERPKYKMLSGPAWLAIYEYGRLRGTPKANDVGDFTAVVEASNGKTSTRATIRGRVVDVNQPPRLGIWTVRVQEGEVLQIDLPGTGAASDEDGDNSRWYP